MDHRSSTPLGTARRNARRRLRPDVTVTDPPSGVVFDHDVPVVVRDGTVLRANVFRPEAPGRYPVLLSAQPYGKDSLPRRRRRGAGHRVPLQYRLAANDAPMAFSAWTALEAPDPGFWVARGYVVVNVDLRGWGTSGGTPEPFSPTEGADVHDAVEWAAAQDWANGRVGMSGVSYLAISQWSAAATRPPHLAAINPWEGFTDAYADFAYPGGVRESGFMVVWSAWQKLLRPSSPSFRGGQKRHELRDEWWQRKAPALEDVEVPALVCGSFSDHSLHSRGSFEGFRRIASPHKWLYTHRGPKWSTYYDPAVQQVQARFFDHFLRGEDNGQLEEPAVRVEVRESRRDVVAVRSADTWPPTQARPVVLHLDAVDNELSPDRPQDAGRTPVPRSGLRLRFRFPEPADVVGPMRLRVPVSTTRGDLTLFAAVRKFSAGREVVFEGSYGFTEDLVTRGWLRASHRPVDLSRSTLWEAHHPHTHREPVEPGTVLDLDLALLPSATRFAAGDELELHLRDRWFFPANQLTGQFPAIYQHTPRQAWSVHTGGDLTATLTIPVWTDDERPLSQHGPADPDH